MELLLLSNSRTPAGYLTDYLEEITQFAKGVRRAVFVPFAAVATPWKEYAGRVEQATGLSLGVVDQAAHVATADLIIVGGGNTFRLLGECRARELLGPIRERVITGKARYLGWSAGSNLACPTIKTTNDMPIVDPGGLDALGLIGFQINPHYLNFSIPGHHGETRNDRLAEFVHANPKLPVIGLPEGDWLRVSGTIAELRGPHPATWFEAGKDPAPIKAGTWRRSVSSNATYDENPQNPRAPG